MDDWRNKRVTIVGLGVHGGGVGAARWLARRGARVTITDLAGESALAPSIAALADVPVERCRLGEHDRRDFLDADAVVVNPAVKPSSPWIALAHEAGARVTSEIELFLNACPARVVAVTGTTGKSSTATMIARVLEADGQRSWLGGNLGGSLLDDVGTMQPQDTVVLEVSSFQLYWLSPQARLPALAVLTNFSENHLDWHGTIDEYALAKRRWFDQQAAIGRAVLNLRDPGVSRWFSSISRPVIAPVDDDQIPPLIVPGDHQRANAALAGAAAMALGCSRDSIRRGLAAFRGLPHRLQLVAEVRRRRFYNDSKATSPAAMLAALEACGPQTWMLIGGVRRGDDPQPWLREMAPRVCGVAFFGAAAGDLLVAAKRYAPELPCAAFAMLPEAVAWCWKQSRPQDSIVLSPAHVSFDAYRDYAARGEHFVAIVQEYAAR